MDRHVVLAIAAMLVLLLSAGPAPARTVNPAPAPVTNSITNSATNSITNSAASLVHPYQSTGRRDPFLSLVYQAIQARKARRGHALMPLERYSISQMTLVAIVSGPGIPSYALVGLPDGKHYILRCGSVAGINKGRVVSIAPDHLVVRETVTGLTGKKITRETVLKLRVQEEQ